MSEAIDIASKLAGRNYPAPAAVANTHVEVERKQFRSGQELYETTPREVPWCWHGFVAYGTVTLFAGRHKGGKSTLLFSLIRSLVDRHDQFLKHPVDEGPVVLLTEEGDETLRPKLEPITPEGRARIRVLGRADLSPRGDYGWAEAVRDAGMEALDWGARVIVVDTFAFWAQIRDENDNSLMQEMVSVVGELATRGLAVIIVHHHRKSGGEDGDAIRGGTALQGAVDIIVELVRPPSEGEGDDASTERELRAIGRFPEIPEALRVKLDGDGTYQVIGEGTKAQLRNLSGEARVLSIVRDAYPSTINGTDVRDASGLSKDMANRHLRSLEKLGDIEAFSDGNGLPKRYLWRGDSSTADYPKGPMTRTCDDPVTDR